MQKTLNFSKNSLTSRPRRNRKSPAIRSLVCETHLKATQLISPQFVIEGKNVEIAINSMPKVFRLSIDRILQEAEKLLRLNICAMALFPVIPKELKDAQGSEATNQEGLLQKAIYQVKKEFPDLCVIADVALDPFTDHGHDGLVSQEGEILNDETLEKLTQMAVAQARAGVDIVAPSDMMDGRVLAIRNALDAEGFQNVGILSYAAKYASSFYGPFREALSSQPSFGDKKSYQMDPSNSREAVREALLDEQEGADILMVKPALAYLDVIAKIKEKTLLPLAAYQVSGEYSMIMAAAQKGWVDEQKVFLETLLSIKRAGADMIFTYAAKQIAAALKNGVPY